jgi:signal transduction histidine kinase
MEERSNVVEVYVRSARSLVERDGPGFPAELAPFERFTRGEAARTRGGAGLGLALVRAIAEGHGGRAEVDGTGVRVFLPG